MYKYYIEIFAINNAIYVHHVRPPYTLHAATVKRTDGPGTGQQALDIDKKVIATIMWFIFDPPCHAYTCTHS